MSIEEFFRKKGHLFNKLAIEKELGLPKRLLDKVINSDKKLPDKWRNKVSKYIKNLGNDIE